MKSTTSTPSEPAAAKLARTDQQQADALVRWLKGLVLIGIGGLALTVITTWLAAAQLGLLDTSGAAPGTWLLAAAIGMLGLLLIRTMGVSTRKAAVTLGFWLFGFGLTWLFGLVAADTPLPILLAFWLFFGAVTGGVFALLPALNGGKRADQTVRQAAAWLGVSALLATVLLLSATVGQLLLLVWCVVGAVQLTRLSLQDQPGSGAPVVVSAAPAEPAPAVIEPAPVVPPAPPPVPTLPVATVTRLIDRFPRATVTLMHGHARDVQALVRAVLSKDAPAEARDFAVRALLEHTLEVWWRYNRTGALTAQDLDDLRSFVQLSVALALDGDSEAGLGDAPNAAVFRSVLAALLDDWVAYKADLEQH